MKPLEILPLLSEYRDPKRYYHNLQHIEEMLEWIHMEPHLEPWALHCLELAVIFHDIVYVPGAKDNEEKSAEYFRAFCKINPVPVPLGFDISYRQRNDTVCDLIMATKEHKGTTFLEKMIIEADLQRLDVEWVDFLDNTMLLFKESGLKFQTFKQNTLAFIKVYKDRTQWIGPRVTDNFNSLEHLFKNI